MPCRVLEDVSDLLMTLYQHSHLLMCRSASCPMCKTPSTKASHDFVLQGMIESTHPQAQSNAVVDNSPIFPSPMLSLGPSRGFDNDPFGSIGASQGEDWSDDDEEMTQEDAEDLTARISFLPAHEPLRPGGNLIFPCNSCAPGNTTGYTCSWPIAMPTFDQIELESQRTGRMIRAPGQDEVKAPLSQANV